MTTPEPRVPIYIDANARHRPRSLRLLAHMALAGREGVLEPDDLAVRAFLAPTGQIRVAPGSWGVASTALGGAGEAYADKFTAEIVKTVNPTDAAGRTDLVILRVKNPYVEGTGDWPIPADAENGPYWDIDVIHGVPPNTNSVHAYNAAWSAITLARITRPANTTVVQQGHITDLRSLVDLSGERIIIIDNPPAEPPPIAEKIWTESTPCQNSATIPSTQTGSWAYFPLAADWQVPIPTWAVGLDVNITCNPQVTGDVWGGMRLVIDEGSGVVDTMGIIPADYDFNYFGGPGPERVTHLVGGTGLLAARHRGKIRRFRLQVRSYDSGNHSGHLAQERGTRVNVLLNFKRVPVVSDGG